MFEIDLYSFLRKTGLILKINLASMHTSPDPFNVRVFKTWAHKYHTKDSRTLLMKKFIDEKLPNLKTLSCFI
jgi:hypothetical protein